MFDSKCYVYLFYSKLLQCVVVIINVIFGGPYDSDKTGVSRCLRVHTLINNHVYCVNVYYVCGQINEILNLVHSFPNFLSKVALYISHRGSLEDLLC